MLKYFADQLIHAEPQTRIEIVYALAMVQETEALSLLAQMWKTEQAPEVKKAISWAGGQIASAKEQGYSTIEAMKNAFNLDLSKHEPTHDTEKMQLLEDEMRRAGIRGHKPESGLASKVAESAAIGAISFAASGGKLLLLHMGAQPPAHNAELAGLELVKRVMAAENRTPLNVKRKTLPPRPTDANINGWLKKLAAIEPQTRMLAIRQLGDFNNPTALGPLGWVFANDSEAEIRQTAQRIGLQIYFGALYWQDFSPQ